MDPEDDIFNVDFTLQNTDPTFDDYIPDGSFNVDFTLQNTDPTFDDYTTGGSASTDGATDNINFDDYGWIDNGDTTPTGTSFPPVDGGYEANRILHDDNDDGGVWVNGNGGDPGFLPAFRAVNDQRLIDLNGVWDNYDALKIQYQIVQSDMTNIMEHLPIIGEPGNYSIDGQYMKQSPVGVTDTYQYDAATGASLELAENIVSSANQLALDVENAGTAYRTAASIYGNTNPKLIAQEANLADFDAQGQLANTEEKWYEGFTTEKVTDLLNVGLQGVLVYLAVNAANNAPDWQDVQDAADEEAEKDAERTRENIILQGNIANQNAQAASDRSEANETTPSVIPTVTFSRT